MYKIYGELYLNDYTRKQFDIPCSSLDAIFSYCKKISRNFCDKYGNWFKPKDMNYSEQPLVIERIQVRTHEHPGYTDFWIYQIENENGIVFSNGKYTDGQKFCSKKVNDWLSECQEKMKSRRFNFVED